MIRPAQLLDVEAILGLEYILFDNAMTERMLFHELTLGKGFVATVDGIIRGYALVRFDDGLMDITRLGVDPATQGQGIGTRLLECALDGVMDAMLTVKKDNLPALRLYRKHGFKIVAHMVGAGAFVLRRRAATLEST